MSSSSVVEWLVDRERTLWLIAVLTYGVGDTTTTIWGLSVVGVAETGPIVAPLVDAYGLVGLLAAKVGSLCGFAAIWWVLWSPPRSAVPLALSVVGIAVTGWNLVTIVAAIG